MCDKGVALEVCTFNTDLFVARYGVPRRQSVELNKSEKRLWCHERQLHVFWSKVARFNGLAAPVARIPGLVQLIHMVRSPVIELRAMRCAADCRRIARAHRAKGEKR